MQRKKEIIEALSSAGFGIIPYIGNEHGKFPLDKGWQDTKPQDNLPTPPRNYGVVLNHKTLVVDIDPRNFKGQNTLKTLLDMSPELKSIIPKTFCVKSGGGGLHVYLRKPEDTQTKYKAKELPGIEFKTYGGQMVGPFSIHPDTKKEYTIQSGSPESIQDAPESLLRFLKVEKKELIAGTTPADLQEDNQVNVEQYIDYLENKAPHAIEGENGDATSLQVALAGRDFGLSEQTVEALMLDHWNENCEPPWELDELRTKVQNAFTYGKKPKGNKAVESKFDVLPEEEPKHTETKMAKILWDYDNKQKLKPTLINLVNIFNTDADLDKVLRFNLFSSEIEIFNRTPWGKIQGLWSDSDAVSLKFYIAKKHQVEYPVMLIHEGISLVAHRNAYHPVKNYIESLVWDGIPRIESWLSSYCGATKNEYTRAVGAKTLLGAVARLYHPGCKFDYTLVLEGAQGIGKSSVCAILGGQWYGNPTLDITNKDTIDQIRSKWIVELAEMETASRAETQAMKAFLTRQTDRVRLAYARNAEEFPRTCIFIGTINPDKAGGYLKDTTGNRRFWPVYCKKVDFAGLERDVDQLWAEARDRFMQGDDKLYLEETHVAEAASVEVNDRLMQDPWEAIVMHWLDTNPDSVHGGARVREITTSEIYEQCLHGSLVKFGKVEQMRIARILLDNGFEQGQIAKGGGRGRGYKR